MSKLVNNVLPNGSVEKLFIVTPDEAEVAKALSGYDRLVVCKDKTYYYTQSEFKGIPCLSQHYVSNCNPKLEEWKHGSDKDPVRTLICSPQFFSYTFFSMMKQGLKTESNSASLANFLLTHANDHAAQMVSNPHTSFSSFYLTDSRLYSTQMEEEGIDQRKVPVLLNSRGVFISSMKISLFWENIGQPWQRAENNIVAGLKNFFKVNKAGTDFCFPMTSGFTLSVTDEYSPMLRYDGLFPPMHPDCRYLSPQMQETLSMRDHCQSDANAVFPMASLRRMDNLDWLIGLKVGDHRMIQADMFTELGINEHGLCVDILMTFQLGDLEVVPQYLPYQQCFNGFSYLTLNQDPLPFLVLGIQKDAYGLNPGLMFPL